MRECVDCLVANPDYPLTTTKPSALRCQFHHRHYALWRNRIDKWNQRERQRHPEDPSARRPPEPWSPPPVPPAHTDEVTLDWEAQEALLSLADRLDRCRNPVANWRDGHAAALTRSQVVALLESAAALSAGIRQALGAQAVDPE